MAGAEVACRSLGGTDVTRDVAAQAVHERLEHFVATMPQPDVDAGWAALVVQLEPPVAPVVPLRRRPRGRRAIVLGVAAAILIGGSALAMVRHAGGGREDRPSGSPASTSPDGAVIGPHVRASLGGSAHRPNAPTSGHGDRNVQPGEAGGRSITGGASVPPTDPAGSRPSQSDPPDTGGQGGGNDGGGNDQGTGNDHGTSDGQGTGNDQGQDTQGNGDGSTGGSSGGDQGSGGGQGSTQRGVGGSGESHGSGGSHEGHGSGGGNGSNAQ